MASEVFTSEITVTNESIDELGHVNNIIYLEWVQDVSNQHWKSKISTKIRTPDYWVVLNHFIEYKNPAFGDDVVVLKTWVGLMEGVKSERHVEIVRKKDNKLIAKVETLWCLIDSKQLRPKRITPEMAALFIE